MHKSEPYKQGIPNAFEFDQKRNLWRQAMATDSALRQKAIDLTIASNLHNYGYQWDWCGVPIIRHPDDMVLQQEIMWQLRPTHVVETGVARGGSLVLSSTLMAMIGSPGKVLGLDLQIFPHAIDSLQPWIRSKQIELFECDSASEKAIERTRLFLSGVSSPTLLVLDSNHSHEHVLSELYALAPLLPSKSIIMVADTIIEEMPSDYYPNRPWSVGNNPLSAVQEFLESRTDFQLDQRWTRRSLMGECRDGILIKI
jgi:cephalosporin hydroxylase